MCTVSLKHRVIFLQQYRTACVILFQCRLLTIDRRDRKKEILETIVVQETASTNIVIKDMSAPCGSSVAGGRTSAAGTICVVGICVGVIIDEHLFFSPDASN